MCASQGLRAGCVAGVLVNRTQQEMPDEETVIESTTVAVAVEAARPLAALNPPPRLDDTASLAGMNAR